MHGPKRSFFRFFILFPFIVFSFASCSPGKLVQKRGGYRLVSNRVVTDRKELSKADLLRLAYPKPNSKVFGLASPGIWVHDAFSSKPDTKTNRWILKHLSTRPVILDTAIVDNSVNAMRSYLENKGYFKSDVSREIDYKGAGAKVTYKTHTSEPYFIRRISYEIQDDTLQKYFNLDVADSYLREKQQYDAYRLGDERERITYSLRQHGYFNFTRDFVSFDVDSTVGNREIDLKVLIENPEESTSTGSDALANGFHKRYFIDEINVRTLRLDELPDTLMLDTVVHHDTRTGEPVFNLVFFNDITIRPSVLARNINLRTGQPFNQQNINYTYNRLQNLGISRYVTIKPTPTGVVSGQRNLLDYDITLIHAPANMFTIEAEGTNNGGLLGLGTSLNFRNRNTFRGAEIFRLKLLGALEFNPGFGINTNDQVIQTIEGGVETGLDFPVLLTPFKLVRLWQNARTKTSVGLGFNFRERTIYTRYLGNLSFGYEWNQSLVKRHVLLPIDLSLINIKRDTSFTRMLMELKDPRFLNQFSNHLVAAARYSFIFNDQNPKEAGNFQYLRVNVEPAGNLLNLYSRVAGLERQIDGRYSIFGIKYAQYFRTDIDFRNHRVYSPVESFVYRLALGAGIPYGNSISLPFEKGFFAGGANSLRGWPIRSVGPGNYAGSERETQNTFERVGELWLESNVEWRFPVNGFLNGAFFTDAGNVWLLNENEDFPGGTLRTDNLLQSIALDAGIGFRFNFNIFIFRIDGALPLHDPGKSDGNRWLAMDKLRLSDINWNFGIGYPF